MGAAVSGLDLAAVEALFARAADEVAAERVPACQVAVARGDEVVARTFGAGESARFMIFSLTKSLVAGAVWLLFGEGSLAPSTRVADVVPEFGSHGKDAVTVAHLLTHTGGFPGAPLRPEEGATSAGRLARFAEWTLDWEPGSRTEYHATSAHWVLAELIERVSGADYRSFVNERIAGALGLSALRLGVPVEQQSDIVPVAVVSDEAVPADRQSVAHVAETASHLLLRYNEPAVRAAGVPGAGGVGSAADLARYFQALLHNPGGFWDPDVLREGTAVVHNDFPDPPTGVPANRTLGLKVAGDDGKAWFREFGKQAGPRAFICSGAGGQVAWADPDTGLSFCFLTSGIAVDVVVSFMRSTALSDLAAACVSG